MGWTTPKTNWTAQDYFELADYNRIRGNLIYLQNIAKSLYPPVKFEQMGEYDLPDFPYLTFWRAPDTNLTALLTGTFCRSDYKGEGKWQENGPVWDDNALNRIESACLYLYQDLQAQTNARQKLKFLMGGVSFGGCI